MPHREEWVNLIVIAKRVYKQEIIDMLHKHGSVMVLQTYVHGSAKDGVLRALGMTPEDNRALLMCFIAKERVQEVFNFLNYKYHFNRPNTGFAFTLPVEKISY